MAKLRTQRNLAAESRQAEKLRQIGYNIFKWIIILIGAMITLSGISRAVKAAKGFVLAPARVTAVGKAWTSSQAPGIYNATLTVGYPFDSPKNFVKVRVSWNENGDRPAVGDVVRIRIDADNKAEIAYSDTTTYDYTGFAVIGAGISLIVIGPKLLLLILKAGTRFVAKTPLKSYIKGSPNP